MLIYLLAHDMMGFVLADYTIYKSNTVEEA